MLGFVLVHMQNVTNGEVKGGWNYMSFFSFVFNAFLFVWFFSSEHAGQVSRTQFRCCFARLVWSEESPVPLTPSPHASSTSPQIQAAHPPSGRGELGTNAEIWVALSSLRCRGNRQHRPWRSFTPSSSDAANGLWTPSQASPPYSCPAAHQWAGP